MALAVTEAALRDLLAAVPFTRAYGFRLHELDEGACTIEVPFQEAFERPGHIVSGQVFMAAADVAMWLAIMTRLGADDASVTSGMTTAFLAAARREDFRCRATILKLGRRLIHGVAECTGRDGTRLTHHTLTYARPASAAAPAEEKIG